MLERRKKTMEKGNKKRRLFGEGKRREAILKHIFVYSLLAVPIVHFLIFWAGINLETILLPFFDQETGAFTLDNFKVVFTAFKAGGDLNIAFRNTLLYWASGMVCSYVMSLSVSYFLYKKIFMHRVFTFLFMLPSMVSSVVFVAIFKNLISTTGPIAVIYEALTDKTFPALLYSNATATWTIVAYGLWTGLGSSIILFSGTMSKIPIDVIEAAQLDGAGFFKEFFLIVFPLIKPTVLTMLIFSVNGILASSGPILLFSGGMYETTTISYWFYEKVILEGNFGVSAAFGFLLSMISMPITLIVHRLANKVEIVEY